MENNSNKKKAEEFSKRVDEFSSGKLSNADDLTRITEVIFESDRMDLLEELSFSAKYAQGLMKIFQDRSNDFEDDYFQKIKIEYTEAVKKIRNLLENVFDDSSAFIGSIFKEKYLGMTQESMLNLKSLIDDFAWVKLYLNDQKRN